MKPINKLSTISTTTTVSLEKIRGFTLDLVFLLANQELRTVDLVDLTGKYAQYINKYLYRMRKYGLAVKKGSYWNLTPLGLSFLLYLENVDRIKKVDIAKHNKTELRQKKDTIKTVLRHLEPKILKQVSLDDFLHKYDLDQTEVVVVEALVEHYRKTGSMFFLVYDYYEFAEKLASDKTGKLNPAALQDALKNLFEDRIVYIYRRRGARVMKIGLYKAFVETLERDGVI